MMYGQMAEDKSKAQLKQHIDQNLKRVYDDALNEELPDRFKQLLERLRQKDAGTGGKS
jgi:hypothetical protein